MAGMTATTSNQGTLRLADWGLIRAQGPDAASFLHGQLTQDINSLPEGSARLAGYCSAKGRLLASFIVWRADADTLYLACSADLLAPTLKRLSMFVLRAKCKLTDASSEISLHGLAGSTAATWLGETAAAAPWTVQAASAGQLVRLTDVQGTPRWLLAQPADAAAPALPALAPADWAALEVASGIVRITAATVEQFVPQMVTLELVGGVNFQKGCYPGQEIVARSQFRGTLKQRAFVAQVAGAAQPGDEVWQTGPDAGAVGTVALAAPELGGLSDVIVSIKLSAQNQALAIGHADGPKLGPLHLPYALAEDI
jgi:hypothetical protein